MGLNKNNTTQNASDELWRPRRSWWKLHVLSVVAMVITLVVLIAVVVPGQPSSGNNGFLFRHGWPVTHAYRIRPYQSAQLDLFLLESRKFELLESRPLFDKFGSVLAFHPLRTAPVWASGLNWPSSHDRTYWIFPSVILNGMCSLIILALMTGSVEVYCRNRGGRRRFLVISTQQLLLMTMVSGVLVAIASQMFSSQKRFEQTVEAVSVYGNVENECAAPQFLVRMFGQKPFDRFKRVTRVSLYDLSGATREPVGAIRAQLKHADCKAIYMHRCHPRMLGLVSDLPHAESIYLSFDHSDNKAIEVTFGPFVTSPKLMELRLGGYSKDKVTFNAESFTGMLSQSAIRQLRVARIDLSQVDWSMASNDQLKVLVFYECALTPDQIDQLKQIQSLERLVVDRDEIDLSSKN